MFKRLIFIHYILLLSYSAFGLNDKIYSVGSSSVETLTRFLSSGNRELGDELVKEFATIYIEEAKHEGINWDVAFVQMCLETGFLKYGGLVDTGQNNFCGLGSFESNKGAVFSTIREGVRAHIQHLKAYSSTEDLNGSLLDPRFHLVQRGSATVVTDLAGRWAQDPKYGIKLLALLKKISIIESGDMILKADVSLITMGSEPVTIPVELSVELSVDDILIPEVPLVKEALIEGSWLR